MASTERPFSFMAFDRCLLQTECNNERENHGQCGDITSFSYGLPPTRFGNSSKKVVHQIWAPGNANVPGGLLDLRVTRCPF